jgi:hypothetical protein
LGAAAGSDAAFLAVPRTPPVAVEPESLRAFRLAAISAFSASSAEMSFDDGFGFAEKLDCETLGLGPGLGVSSFLDAAFLADGFFLAGDLSDAFFLLDAMGYLTKE